MKTPKSHVPEKLVPAFERRFATRAHLSRAPGRVNLIGEHTDYNQGFVMPAAIDFSAWVAIAPREDRHVVITSAQFPDELEFSLDEPAGPRKHWTDYAQGVAVILEKAGHRLRGANLMIDSEVPIGSGLSSSAALEVAVGFSLLRASGLQVALVELAKLCQRAENEFVGARCGIMDQFISCLAERGHCLMIDCRSLDFRAVKIPAEVSIVICNTMIKHSLAGGEYNLRRAQCEEGVSRLSQSKPGIHSLRDVTPEQFAHYEQQLPEVIRKRCRHVIFENQRVIHAARALEAEDLEHFGKLMRQSHKSLRDDYEVSCRELDLMVEIAGRQPGVYGARMTGGGFGGCTVNLVRADAAETVVAEIRAEYTRQTEIKPEIYITGAAAGVEQML
jgi:galactokinase